jgi:hypothetical protein
MKFGKLPAVGWRSLWIRPSVTYPSLHYRYSYDIAHVLELQTVGAHAKSGKVQWKVRQLAAATLVALSPIALAAVLDVTGIMRPPQNLAAGYFGWLGYFLFLTAFAVVVACIGVRVFHNLTDSLERCLTPTGRDVYDRWANLTTAFMPQLAYSLIFSAGACVALWVASSAPVVSHRLYVAAPSYMAVATCAYFIAQGSYWIITGTILSILLTRPGRLDPIWHSPAYTPGIELLARCYRLSFYGASISVGLCLFPLLTWLYKAPSSPALTIIKVSLFVLSATAALLIAVIPQWRLSLVVSRQRRSAFDALSAKLPLDPKKLLQAMLLKTQYWPGSR